MTRGSPAVVIVPKAAEPNDVFGLFSGGVFVKLKISMRNSMFVVSVIFVRLMIPKSMLR